MDNQDYYSIDAILADNQKLPCTFLLDVEGLGYLDGGSGNDIKEHAKVEIPFWLAQTLALNEFVSFTIPPPFSPRVRNALNASPHSVKLSNLVGAQGMWYGFGRRLIGVLDDPQANSLSALLTTTFKFRLPEIQDRAQHAAFLSSGGSSGGSLAGREAMGEFSAGMEGEERELFAIAMESAKQMRVWGDGSTPGESHR